MLYFLIVVLLIVIVLFSLSWCRITIELNLDNQLLDISVGNRFLKKKFSVDFSDKPDEKKKDAQASSEKKNPLKEKLAGIRDRIYTKENGINIDGIRSLKDEFSEIYSQFSELTKDFFSKMRYKIHVTVLQIELEYGTGDAADTGMLYGAIYGLVSTLYPIAARWAYLPYPTMKITPDFYGKRFDIKAQSIIKVRPAHIINASISALFTPALTYFKDKIFKGREKNGRQASN